MLVLSRLENEAIVIGGNIVVRVVKVRGGKVKLGVDAPDEVRIDREEIHELRTAEAGTEGDRPRDHGSGSTTDQGTAGGTDATKGSQS